MPCTRVVNIRVSPCDIYIGRGSKWGNRYSHKPSSYDVIHVPSREEAIRRYEHDLLNNDTLVRDLKELCGKVLGCYCKPLSCHGDVLAELADSLYGEGD